MPARDELLREARALDAQAVERDDPPLRRKAAELRRQALGEKPYPVLICGACFRLTGWLTSDGVCAYDAMRRRERSRGGFWDVRDRRRPVRERRSARLRRMFHGDRERTARWLERVEPGTTGPIAPENGWELEWPMTTERRAPEGLGIVVFFEVHSLRFDGGHWREVATTSGGKPFTLVPREYPASLPTEQLAEAWSDFCEEVAAHNRAVWLREAERREAARTRDAEARAAEELERGTSELFG